VKLWTYEKREKSIYPATLAVNVLARATMTFESANYKNYKYIICWVIHSVICFDALYLAHARGLSVTSRVLCQNPSRWPRAWSFAERKFSLSLSLSHSLSIYPHVFLYLRYFFFLIRLQLLTLAGSGIVWLRSCYIPVL